MEAQYQQQQQQQQNLTSKIDDYQHKDENEQNKAIKSPPQPTGHHEIEEEVIVTNFVLDLLAVLSSHSDNANQSGSNNNSDSGNSKISRLALAGIASNRSTILCYGRNTARLRMVSFTFAYQLARSRCTDVQLIRVSHLPNLFDSYESACKLVPSIDDAAFLSFVNVYYHPTSTGLIKHLLKGEESTKARLPQESIVLEELTNYIQSTVLTATAEPAANATKPKGPKSMLYNAYRMTAFLVNTMGYSALKPLNDTKNEPVFLVTLDLDRFFQLVLHPTDRGNAEKEDTILKHFGAVFFRHRIDVDRIDMDHQIMETPK